MASRISYILCTALMLYVCLFFNPKWERKAGETSLGWDASTYYWYLPATFIYHDLKHHAFGDSIIAKYDFTPEFEQAYLHESGNRVLTYSSGMAFMEMPAFFIAHVLAKPLGYEADGFSLPYQVAVQLWGLLWSLIGLWYFRKLLLYYFSDKTVAISLILLVFGTNYLNYAGIDPTLTHSWLFTIYVFLMLNTRRFYMEPSYKYAVRIGLLTGTAILIRPSEMVAVIIPLLWGMEGISFNAIKAKWQFLLQHFRYLLAAAGCVIMVGSIQIAYWLYVTGQPLVYSYADKEFSWLHPHFKDFTFSYRSGWLMYTPMLIFAFIGLIPLWFKGKNKVAITVFFFVNYYIVASWDIWWYGGMGGRAMVQSYAVLFFPVAALVETLLSTRWIKWPVFVLMALGAYINIWFTYNARSAGGLYDPNGMNKAYYWHVLGRFHVPPRTVLYKDIDELYDGVPVDMKLLYTNGFEDDTTETDVLPISGTRSLYMYGGREYGPHIRFAYNGDDGADWIRTEVKVKLLNFEPDNWRMLQMVVAFVKGNEQVKSSMMRLNRIAAIGVVKDIYFDMRVPGQDFDSVQVIFWNPGSEKGMKLDDLEVYSFKE